MDRPTVALFADPDGFSIRLLESLIANLCRVIVLAQNQETWEDATRHLSQKSLFRIVNLASQKELADFDYLLAIDIDLNKIPAEMLAVARLAAAQAARILAVLPYVAEGISAWQRREKLRGLILKKIPEAGIVYLGELYGPRYWGKDKDFITRNLTAATFDGETESLEEDSLFPVSVEGAARYLVRNLFSFGPYGREVAVFSDEIPASAFLSLLSQEVALVSFARPKFGGERQEVLGIKKVFVKEDFSRGTKETIVWLKRNLVPEAVVAKKKHGRSYFLKRGVVLGLLILLIAPFLLLLAGGSAGLFSYFLIKKGRWEAGERGLVFGAASLRHSLTFLSVYRRLPLVSYAYQPFVVPEKVGYLSFDAAVVVAEAVRKTQVLAASVLGAEPYDPVPVAGEIAFELNELYTKTGFLESEIKSLGPRGSGFFGRFLSETKLEAFRAKVLGAKNLSLSLPQILGKDKPKTYLVLFQNNMELRPTGGFIGSFGLASFDAGRLIDINVFDVYAADGGLKGHVEPPGPIKKYLGEANWFLRDSNWDPDFPTSANRAKWFLDKEMDRSVDGVIGVDLEVVRGFLQTTGPAVLADFNQAFDYNNLYGKLQAEVEAGFFPGSQKKASLLTALARELMKRASSLPQEAYVPVARKIFQNLEERHIQIALDDAGAEKAVSLMDYSGELSGGSCPGKCFLDFVAPVDANVGVTKANYFIKRDFSLDVTVGNETVKKMLVITYANTANPSLGVAARYRTYTRLFVPPNSIFQKAKIDNAGVAVEADLEEENFETRKSGGINLEVSPGQTKKLIFSWETPIPSGPPTTEYRLAIRKQAGTTVDPLVINVLTPTDSKSYNTNLARDFSARFNF